MGTALKRLHQLQCFLCIPYLLSIHVLFNASFLVDTSWRYCLTDNAYACDPRIAKFKEDAKLKKQREKDEKREAARRKQEQEEKVGMNRV